ncbi:hypothetical protein AZI86_11105 [Bdellovibrio bacteriovorus]|uniref:Uncharacterized protein n=2 Tax=Bdellovibrio bacteriovorus TaxID=959 RepID=A0A150WLT0_BDEBC|nr:hypothetical protein AZI86_11105 [Bdellovibrio bacteriovorus]
MILKDDPLTRLLLSRLKAFIQAWWLYLVLLLVGVGALFCFYVPDIYVIKTTYAGDLTDLDLISRIVYEKEVIEELDNKFQLSKTHGIPDEDLVPYYLKKVEHKFIGTEVLHLFIKDSDKNSALTFSNFLTEVAARDFKIRNQSQRILSVEGPELSKGSNLGLKLLGFLVTSLTLFVLLSLYLLRFELLHRK